MSIKIRCPHCHHYVAMPDGEAQWHDFAQAGWTIQTVAERVVLQPLIKKYETPEPVLKAIALGIPVVCLGSSFGMYFGVNPVMVAITETAICGALFFWASGQMEMREITDDGSEGEQDVVEPERVLPAEEVLRTKNTMSIKVLYEPPTGDTPDATRRLASLTLALARMATDEDSPLEPVSFDGAKARRWSGGNPAFTTIQGHWISRGLAMMTDRNWCYLTNRGRRILRKLAEQ